MNSERDRRLPNESQQEYERRMKYNAEQRALRMPGGYMSTRNADGSSRGGAAEMFEKYGFL